MADLPTSAITDLPPVTEEALEEYLSQPTTETIAALARCDGDVLVLGAGGKIGPSLCRLAQRSLAAAGSRSRVVAVSRFSNPASGEHLAAAGIETIAADLLDERALAALPDAPNVLYLGGMKFGAAGAPDQTWALNTLMPGLVARRFARSRIVVFSTGNVYPLTGVRSGGAVETDPPSPVGEYAQSCLGRERMFEYYSRQSGTPVVVIRLNYAIDLRYGVLHDVARAVYEERPVDLTMGNVNVIWQGDANALALRALTVAASPPKLLNLTGPETIAVRWLAAQFAARFGVPPRFVGDEAPTALLSNAAEAFRLFGYPRVPLGQMIDWTAHWIRAGGPTLDKPTHFQEREGRF